MKKMCEEIGLTGKMEYITCMDLRRQPGDVLDQAALGKVFIVTKAGKPWAVISGLPGQQLAISVQSNGSIRYELVQSSAKDLGFQDTEEASEQKNEMSKEINERAKQISQILMTHTISGAKRST